MENLQQIVIQITNSPEVRSILQYGDDFIPESQTLVKYDDLTREEKVVWDDFINMITSK